MFPQWQVFSKEKWAAAIQGVKWSVKLCHFPPSYIILCWQLHGFSYVSRPALRQSIITYVTFKDHSYCTADKEALASPEDTSSGSGELKTLFPLCFVAVCSTVFFGSAEALIWCRCSNPLMEELRRTDILPPPCQCSVISCSSSSSAADSSASSLVCWSSGNSSSGLLLFSCRKDGTLSGEK